MASLLTMVGCGDDNDDNKQPECGNGTVETGEQCDDGNKANGDGCSATCQNETPATPTTPVCGNGTVETGEQCDDGNKVNGDGCSATCQKETSASSCPVVGSSCSVEFDQKCCDDNVYFCEEDENGKLVWYEWNCKTFSEEVGFETHCHSVTSEGSVWAECTDECTADDLNYIMEYATDCVEGNFELWVCEKTDENKYASMGGYFAESLCWTESTKIVCDADDITEEVECANCEDTESGAVCQ